MAILEVKGLTMRFGGLTAVNKVDFAVEKGQIFSVIGPNGAGKTTVFNAITGVYEPTEGEVLFDGKDVRRPFRAAVVAGIAAIGLLSGLAVMILSTDIDALWRATVVLNYTDSGEPFSWTAAYRSLLGHLNADVTAEREVNRLTELEIREKDGVALIRSRGNKAVLESCPDRETAERRLEILEAMVNLTGSLRTTVKEADGKWAVRAPEGTVLERFDTREQAGQRLNYLASQAGKVRWRLKTRASEQPLGTATALVDALKLAEMMDAMVSKPRKMRVTERGGRFYVGPASLAGFDTKADAEEYQATFKQIAAARTRQRWLLWIWLVVGTAIGAGGAYVVWNRARRTPDVITEHGLARTFQNIRLFPDMLAVENVLMGMHCRLTTRLWQMALRTAGFHREETASRGKAMELLEFVGVSKRASDLAKSLPYGDQRRLEIARALATEPKILLLDEPGAGMNPAETSDLMKLISKIRDRGITVVLIEHHMKVVMGISDHIVVLDYGTKIAEGTPAEVRANPKVIEAYLGKEEVG